MVWKRGNLVLVHLAFFRYSENICCLQNIENLHCIFKVLKDFPFLFGTFPFLLFAHLKISLWNFWTWTVTAQGNQAIDEFPFHFYLTKENSDSLGAYGNVIKLQSPSLWCSKQILKMQTNKQKKQANKQKTLIWSAWGLWGSAVTSLNFKCCINECHKERN